MLLSRNSIQYFAWKLFYRLVLLYPLYISVQWFTIIAFRMEYFRLTSYIFLAGKGCNLYIQHLILHVENMIKPFLKGSGGINFSLSWKMCFSVLSTVYLFFILKYWPLGSQMQCYGEKNSRVIFIWTDFPHEVYLCCMTQFFFFKHTFIVFIVFDMILVRIQK